MKKNIRLLIPLLILTLLSGCGLFGANPKAPTKFEQAIFDVVTNVVQRVVTVTNTETRVAVVLHTNEVGVTVTQTNIVLVPMIVQETNYSEAYTLTPKPQVRETAQAAGSVSNLILPGSGGLVAGILAGIATMWAKLRSSKNTSNALAQNIETMLEFIKTLPNGVAQNEAIKQFLQKYQADAGVLTKVLSILQKDVSNPEAQAGVIEIQTSLNNKLPTP
jgi:hypothetical protein